eukprot:352571_1
MRHTIEQRKLISDCWRARMSYLGAYQEYLETADERGFAISADGHCQSEKYGQDSGFISGKWHCQQPFEPNCDCARVQTDKDAFFKRMGHQSQHNDSKGRLPWV